MIEVGIYFKWIFAPKWLSLLDMMKMNQEYIQDIQVESCPYFKWNNILVMQVTLDKTFTNESRWNGIGRINIEMNLPYYDLKDNKIHIQSVLIRTTQWWNHFLQIRVLTHKLRLYEFRTPDSKFYLRDDRYSGIKSVPMNRERN